MGLYYRLDYKNNKNHLNQKDSVPVIIDYYYKGKRTKQVLPKRVFQSTNKTCRPMLLPLACQTSLVCIQ